MKNEEQDLGAQSATAVEAAGSSERDAASHADDLCDGCGHRRIAHWAGSGQRCVVFSPFPQYGTSGQCTCERFIEKIGNGNPASTGTRGSLRSAAPKTSSSNDKTPPTPEDRT